MFIIDVCDNETETSVLYLTIYDKELNEELAVTNAGVRLEDGDGLDYPELFNDIDVMRLGTENVYEVTYIRFLDDGTNVTNMVRKI